MVSVEQKKLQYAQLNILREFDKVCKEKKLTYWMAFGSAIGAVRHGGFIPWDDDIDLFMLAEDLEKLETYQVCFPENIFIQSRRTDPDYGLMISRVRDSNTTLIEDSESDRDINHGIFIDIYPLYNAPTDKKEFKKFYISSLLARLFQYGKVPEKHGIIMKLGSFLLLLFTTGKYRKKQVERLYNRMVEHPETGYLSYAYGGLGEKLIFPKEYFLPIIRVDFEDLKVPIQENYDKLLTAIYGDYMKLPPIDEQVVHHDYSKIDFKHSYSDFRGIDYCRKDKR